MNKNVWVMAAAMVSGMLLISCGISKKMAGVSRYTDDQWNTHLGRIDFEDQDKGSEGSRIYHAIIPNPDAYIRQVTATVMRTLYFKPSDSIPACKRLHYIIRDDKGISAKGGGNGFVDIFYSTRHIKRSFANNDTAKVLFETRGVLLHELTHAFQLEPQGIGGYGDNKVVWSFIEGMADAVRVANGGFHGEQDRPKGGNYMDGYRTTGYFLNWVKDHKDKDFIRKMNRSTLEVVPWSWDGAVKYALGKKYGVDALWHEYQVTIGDIKSN